MANLVGQIIDAIQSTCATATSANSFQALPFTSDVKKNNVRTARKSYGVRPLEAVNAETILKTYTVNHKFEVILTDVITRGADDEALETSIKLLYNMADEIFVLALKTKLGLSSVVLNVFEPSILEPELYEKEQIVVLRMQFTVKWRNTLT